MQATIKPITNLIPFTKINKVFKTNWRYFEIEGKLCVSNGHLCFFISMEYWDVASNSMQFDHFPFCNANTVHEWIGLIVRNQLYKKPLDQYQGTFDSSFYNAEYLEILKQFPGIKLVKNYCYKTFIWHSQLSVWETPEMQIILGGCLKSNEEVNSCK